MVVRGSQKAILIDSFYLNFQISPPQCPHGVSEDQSRKPGSALVMLISAASPAASTGTGTASTAASATPSTAREIRGRFDGRYAPPKPVTCRPRIRRFSAVLFLSDVQERRGTCQGLDSATLPQAKPKAPAPHENVHALRFGRSAFIPLRG